MERFSWLFWSLRDAWNNFSDYPHRSVTHGAISLIILIALWIVFDHLGTQKLRAPIRRMICDFMQADCSTSRIATVVPGSSRRRLGAGWWRSGIVTNLAPGDVGDWRRAHIQDLKTRRLQPNLPATAAARLETRMWYHMWYHNGCDIICDITCDISHVMSHMISYAIMWYHACDIICDIMVWCGKMNMISHMMNLFVAYDFTCDITGFWVWYHHYASLLNSSLKRVTASGDSGLWLWYHIIVISHCDIIHDIICDVHLDHMM